MATIKMVEGGRLYMRLTYRIAGVPQPLAGWVFQSQIRSKAKGLLLIDLGDFAAVEPEGATGIIQIQVPATETVGMTTDAVFDMFLMREDDPTQRFFLTGGKVDVKQAVTSA